MAEGEQPARKKSKLPEHKPWLPTPYEPADVGALKALANGTANAEQQQRALNFIITKICGTYDETYFPGGEEGRRDSDYAAGMRKVGLTIVKMLKLSFQQKG
jgi:hypothetical protein